MRSAPRIICTACSRSRLRRTGPPHRRPGVPSCPCPASSRSTAAAICGATWWRCAAPRRSPFEQQPALFTLREDHRPAGERDHRGRRLQAGARLFRAARLCDRRPCAARDGRHQRVTCGSLADCVKTCLSRDYGEFFSALCRRDERKERCCFSYLRNRDGNSTFEKRVRVFAQSA
jgi:hypothetical protein